MEVKLSGVLGSGVQTVRNLWQWRSNCQESFAMTVKHCKDSLAVDVKRCQEFLAMEVKHCQNIWQWKSKSLAMEVKRCQESMAMKVKRCRMTVHKQGRRRGTE